MAGTHGRMGSPDSGADSDPDQALRLGSSRLTRIGPADRRTRIGLADSGHAAPTRIGPGATADSDEGALSELGSSRVGSGRLAFKRGGERRSKTPMHEDWVGQGCSTQGSAAGLSSNPHAPREGTGTCSFLPSRDRSVLGPARRCGQGPLSRVGSRDRSNSEDPIPRRLVLP